MRDDSPQIVPPFEGVIHGDGSATINTTEPGATLRDLFACAALVGVLAGNRGFDPFQCWKYADTMLASRSPADPTPPPAEGGV